MKTHPLGLLLALGLVIGAPGSLLAQVPDLEGNYIANGGRTTWEDWVFTDAGKQRFDTYNFATDDPALQCLASYLEEGGDPANVGRGPRWRSPLSICVRSDARTA